MGSAPSSGITRAFISSLNATPNAMPAVAVRIQLFAESSAKARRYYDIGRQLARAQLVDRFS